jgi:spectinomycin phosphotransferase
LWTGIADWTVIVYPWIWGDSRLTGMTDEQWKQVGTNFKQIHQVMLPPFGFESLRKETFDPRQYMQWVRAFETQHGHVEGGGVVERALRSCWVAHQSTIHTILTSLETLAGVLRSRTFSYVICHGDLHARNLIRDRAGQVFVIDWDEVMLAPKERDFLFVRPPHAAAFWQGYGQVEIDWVALTYFLWERVVQDLIECTGNVWFREDWGEESRLEAAQLLEVILAEDRGHIDAAYQASAHLPTELTVGRRKSS